MVASETFPDDELRAIAEVMRAFERRCDEILALLGDKRYLTRNERMQIELLYRGLKDDIKRAAKHGTLSGLRAPLSRAEQCFYDPAVRRAATDLRPATNSNPITSRWFSAINDARGEFSYWLSNLEQNYPDV